MRSGWIRYERIAGFLRCHRHGVKQQVFCKGDPEKLSCLRQQALCRVPDSKGRGRHLQNRKIRGETPLMERGLAALPFASMGKGGRRAGPSARSRCPSTSILHLPAASRADTNAAVAGRTGRSFLCADGAHRRDQQGRQPYRWWKCAPQRLGGYPLNQETAQSATVKTAALCFCKRTVEGTVTDELDFLHLANII